VDLEETRIKIAVPNAWKVKSIGSESGNERSKTKLELELEVVSPVIKVYGSETKMESETESRGDLVNP